MSTAAWARFSSRSSCSGEVGCFSLDRSKVCVGDLASLKPGGAEENDGVLDLFAAEAGQRLLVFRQHAQNAAVGAVEERFVLIGDRRGFEMVSHS